MKNNKILKSIGCFIFFIAALPLLVGIAAGNLVYLLHFLDHPGAVYGYPYNHGYQGITIYFGGKAMLSTFLIIIANAVIYIMMAKGREVFWPTFLWSALLLSISGGAIAKWIDSGWPLGYEIFAASIALIALACPWILFKSIYATKTKPNLLKYTAIIGLVSLVLLSISTRLVALFMNG